MTDPGSAGSTPARKRRKVNGKGKNYADISDQQFFDAWDANESDAQEEEDEAAAISAGRAHQLRQAERSVNKCVREMVRVADRRSMKLQNIVMQLRKVCNHRASAIDRPRLTAQPGCSTGLAIRTRVSRSSTTISSTLRARCFCSIACSRSCSRAATRSCSSGARLPTRRLASQTVVCGAYLASVSLR